MVLIFYSGHGGLNLTPQVKNPMEIANISFQAILTLIISSQQQYKTPQLPECCREFSRTRWFFLIDCCYSGGATTGQEIVKSVSPSSIKVETDVYNELSGSGRVIISASLPDQVSFELPKLNHAYSHTICLREYQES